VTRLLNAASSGDSAAASTLFPVVYDELRRLARHSLKSERPDHTLQATALVHEAFVRLAGPGGAEVTSRAHFLALAARAMRRILVDHAVARQAIKRGGGGGARVPLEEIAVVGDEGGVDLVALESALTRLGEIDPEKAQIVEMRYFGGLTHEEIAGVLGQSERSIRRGWTFARAWLHGELSRGAVP